MKSHLFLSIAAVVAMLLTQTVVAQKAKSLDTEFTFSSLIQPHTGGSFSYASYNDADLTKRLKIDLPSMFKPWSCYREKVTLDKENSRWLSTISCSNNNTQEHRESVVACAYNKLSSYRIDTYIQGLDDSVFVLRAECKTHR